MERKCLPIRGGRSPRVLGVLLIVSGLVGPVAWLYQRNVAAVPKQRVLAAGSVSAQPATCAAPQMLHLPR